MRKKTTSFNNLMTAVSFAESGEFDTVSSLLKESKHVLLVYREGQVQEKTLHYALSVCQRIGAGLEILYVSGSGKPEAALQRLLGKLKQDQTPHQLVHASGALYEVLVRHVKAQTAVTCAVLSSSDSLNIADQWSTVGCPLVVVEA